MSESGSVEECTLITFAWPPRLTDDDKSAEAQWSGLQSFGEAVIISLAANPSKHELVPAMHVVTLPDSLPGSMKPFVSRHAAVVSQLFQIVISSNVTDPRPVLLPNVKESDEVRTFQSDHPYAENVDTFEEVSLPGAKAITITFDAQCRTGLLTQIRFQTIIDCVP